MRSWPSASPPLGRAAAQLHERATFGRPSSKAREAGPPFRCAVRQGSVINGGTAPFRPSTPLAALGGRPAALTGSGCDAEARTGPRAGWPGDQCEKGRAMGRRGRRRKGQPPVTVRPMCQLCRWHGDGQYRRTEQGVRLCQACWDLLAENRDVAEWSAGAEASRQDGPEPAPERQRPVTVSRDELQRIRRR